MRTIRALPIVVSAMAMLAMCVYSQAVAEKPLALLLATTGEVTVTRASGESAPGQFGMHLSAGDVVKTGAGGSAEILLEDGNSIQIGANGSMQIKEPQSKPAEMPPGSFETVQNFLKLKNSQGTSSLSALRSGEKAAELRAESPCRTKIRNGDTTFHWYASDPSAEVKVTLYNDSGVQWSAEVTGVTRAKYTGSEPLVSGVAYSWVVETVDPMVIPPLRSQNAYFEVLSAAAEKELDEALSQAGKTKKAEPGYHIVRASLFYGHGLVEDAIRETDEAARLDAGNPALHAILARLYADVGRTQAALSEYDQLLEKQ